MILHAYPNGTLTTQRTPGYAVTTGADSAVVARCGPTFPENPTNSLVCIENPALAKAWAGVFLATKNPPVKGGSLRNKELINEH